MKPIFLILFFILFLIGGLLSGIASERYLHREECLKLAFDNSGVETLSDDEITDALKTLNNSNENFAPETDGGTSEKKFVGSKNSQKFYPADCRYTKLIKEENKVYFETQEEGEKSGKIFIDCQ